MARSMTAYGRAHGETSQGLFLIEIYSVNRKSLDIHTNLPKELLFLDMELRKKVSEKVKRGMVTVRMTKESGNGNTLDLPSMEHLKTLHSKWSLVAETLGYDPHEAVPFSLLMETALSSSNMAQGQDETFKKQVFGGLDQALSTFMKMKETEGKTLSEDIFPRLEMIAKKVQEIAPNAKKAPKRLHDKLKKKLEELKINHEGDEERLSRELVLFVDRIDVTEELTRLGSHIAQFETILKEGKERVGRELDFLTQEMHREANTIAAKSQELEITQSVLAVKSELEKIREQLQNIE